MPVVEQGVFAVKLPPVRELGEECFGGVGFEFEPFLAAVAEGFEERDGSVTKGFLREISEGVFDRRVWWLRHSWILDDQPSDKLKVGGFGRLVFFVWNHEAALGLQTCDDAFLESACDRFDRFLE